MFGSRAALAIALVAVAVAFAVVAFVGWPFLGILLLLVLIPAGAVVAGVGRGAKQTARPRREWTEATTDPDRRGAIRADGGMISDRERASG
jgi:hypothetical protein